MRNINHGTSYSRNVEFGSVKSSVSPGSSPGGTWGTPSDVTISGGVIIIPTSGIYNVYPEVGVTDSITSITVAGISYGDEIILASSTGNTITITKGAFLKMPMNCILNNVDDEIRLRYIGSDTFREVVRVSNS